MGGGTTEGKEGWRERKQREREREREREGEETERERERGRERMIESRCIVRKKKQNEGRKIHKRVNFGRNVER